MKLNLDEYFDVTEPLKRHSGNGYITDLFPIKEKIQTKDILKRSDLQIEEDLKLIGKRALDSMSFAQGNNISVLDAIDDLLI